MISPEYLPRHSRLDSEATPRRRSPGRPAPHRPPLVVLVICLANTYRSPLAQHLLSRAFDDVGISARVTSAGVAAIDGRPMEPSVRALLSERGIEVADGWTARRLTPALARSVDLILTSDVARNADVTRLAPNTLRSVFTVGQFARFMRLVAQSPDLPAAGGPTQRLPVDILSAVGAVRGLGQRGGPGTDDLHDPVGRPPSALRRAAADIERLTSDIAGGIARIGLPRG